MLREEGDSMAERWVADRAVLEDSQQKEHRRLEEGILQEDSRDRLCGADRDAQVEDTYALEDIVFVELPGTEEGRQQEQREKYARVAEMSVEEERRAGEKKGVQPLVPYIPC